MNRPSDTPAPSASLHTCRRRTRPPATWRDCPSPPHTAPSPPAACAGTPTRTPPPAPPQPHFARAQITGGLPRSPAKLALGVPCWAVFTETALDRVGSLSPEAPSGGFDCRRSQAEQPAAFKAVPSEIWGGACISGPNPVFGSRGGREARCCSGSSAPTARVRFRSPSRRVSPAARFLLASHRTGRADFPHPALGQISRGAFSAAPLWPSRRASLGTLRAL